MLLHGAVAAAMIHWNEDDASEPTAAMVVDLAPFPVAPPESVTDLPPGPEQVEAEASPQTPVNEVKEQVEEQLETEQSQEIQPELAPAVNPEVALDTLPPKPEQQVEMPQENQLPAPETTAPPQMPQFEPAEVAAAQVQGPPTVERSNAIPTWRARWPRSGTQQAISGGCAQRSRHRAGRVQHRSQGPRNVSRIVATSGSPALDREALEMVGGRSHSHHRRQRCPERKSA